MNTHLLIVDLTASSLLVVDGLTNAITAEIALPSDEAITDLCIAAGNEKVFLPAASHAGKGALYVMNLSTLSLYRLPVVIAHPSAFALCGKLACFADPSGRLYLLDTTLLTVEEWKSPLLDGRCIQIAATANSFLSLWENDTMGLAAVMNLSGELVTQSHLPGSPTSLVISLSGYAYAACTSADNTMHILRLPIEQNSPPTAAAMRCPVCHHGLTGYPAALAANKQALYVITEEGELTTIDQVSGHTASHAILGQPLDSLHLLPCGRRAIGHSLLKGNLALIDLEGGRILAMTATEHRLGPIAVLS